MSFYCKVLCCKVLPQPIISVIRCHMWFWSSGRWWERKRRTWCPSWNNWHKNKSRGTGIFNGFDYLYDNTYLSIISKLMQVYIFLPTKRLVLFSFFFFYPSKYVILLQSFMLQSITPTYHFSYTMPYVVLVIREVMRTKKTNMMSLVK